MLCAVVKDNAKAEHALEQMITYYLARDMAGFREWILKQMTRTDTGLYENFKQRVITARNRRITDRMKPRRAEGGAFIAVGAMHLPGELGIVRLVEVRGYAVERLY